MLITGVEVTDFREMQETETIDQVQSKDSLAEKKESSEGFGLLPSIDHNITDAHTGYNVHREALNEAVVISGDQFHEPASMVGFSTNVRSSGGPNYLVLFDLLFLKL